MADMSFLVALTGSGGSGGSGKDGVDGLDILYCANGDVAVGAETTVEAADFTIPAGRSVDIGDLCFCANGVVGQVSSISGTTYQVTGLFQMDSGASTEEIMAQLVAEF